MTQIAAVQPAAPPQSAKSADKANAQATQGSQAEGAASAGGAVSAQSAFHSMLQGVSHAALPSDAAASADDGLAGGEGALLLDMPVMLSIDSLVGQTARLDAQADLAQRNGVLSAGAGVAGGWLGAGQGTALSALSLGFGAGVETVAAGVGGVGVALPTAVALDAGKAQLQQAVGDAAAMLQGAADSVGDAPLAEGRMVLSGDWQLATDPTPTPAMDRVMGQVEQWAAAAAGLQPKGRLQEGGASAVPAGTEVSALSSASSSGTRLTEQAVREAVQTEQAGTTDGPEQPPVEDMRFWLQGRQQRAQVVLSHGDQQVRVQVAVQGQQAHVIFSSDAEATRAHLDAELAQLREQLQEQGVELVGVRVQDNSGEGAAGQQGFGASGQADAGMWGAGVAARTGQVAVPVEAADSAGAQRSRTAGGVDLYA